MNADFIQNLLFMTELLILNLGKSGTEFGDIMYHWLTNKLVDLILTCYFWINMDSAPKQIPRLILSTAPFHRPTGCVGHPLVCYTNTGHHHPSTRLAKHLFMA